MQRRTCWGQLPHDLLFLSAEIVGYVTCFSPILLSFSICHIFQNELPMTTEVPLYGKMVAVLVPLLQYCYIAAVSHNPVIIISNTPWQLLRRKRRSWRFPMLPTSFPKGNSMGNLAGWCKFLFLVIRVHSGSLFTQRNISETMTQKVTSYLLCFCISKYPNIPLSSKKIRTGTFNLTEWQIKVMKTN